MHRMRVGIELPAEADMTLIGIGRRGGGSGLRRFALIDRLLYEDLDPPTALAIAAPRTAGSS